MTDNIHLATTDFNGVTATHPLALPLTPTVLLLTIFGDDIQDSILLNRDSHEINMYNGNLYRLVYSVMGVVSFVASVNS
jgi:hypothetical protein